ncbi:MAG: hypothetical protein QGI29_03715 [Pirellulales bacterium]|nr:hypothetical protein [Pirellulales bacterium]
METVDRRHVVDGHSAVLRVRSGGMEALSGTLNVASYFRLPTNRAE